MGRRVTAAIHHHHSYYFITKPEGWQSHRYEDRGKEREDDAEWRRASSHDDFGEPDAFDGMPMTRYRTASYC